MNFKLRIMTFDDIPKAMLLKNAVGWNQTAADWDRFLSANPDGCFVAQARNDIVGTVTTIIYEGWLAWIGMLLVEEQYRGRGIGNALLKHAIGFLDSHGVRTVKLDATPLGKPLYEKLGFTGEYDIERWMLNRTVKKLAPENEVKSMDEILALDRKIFGADRRELLLSLAQEAPHLALVDRQEGITAGYSFGRLGSRADQMGPWVAHNENAAKELLNSFLARSSRECIFIDCLRLNPWAVPLAKTRGFEFSRPLTRMFRGTNYYPGQPEYMCASLGPEFG